MLYLTGDTRSKKLVAQLERLGIARIVVDQKIIPYEGEKWGFDNGAYRDFLSGKDFDADRYLRKVDMVGEIGIPYMVVVPDKVCGGRESLDLSMEWVERLPRKWDKYLVVQDGMAIEDVRPVIAKFAGIFLGGSDAFKYTAYYWSALAHEHSIMFHYGRCGTARKIAYAKMVCADSCDSALPLWINSRFAEFLRYMERGPDQPEFPNPRFHAVEPEAFITKFMAGTGRERWNVNAI